MNTFRRGYSLKTWSRWVTSSLSLLSDFCSVSKPLDPWDSRPRYLIPFLQLRSLCVVLIVNCTSMYNARRMRHITHLLQTILKHRQSWTVDQLEILCIVKVESTDPGLSKSPPYTNFELYISSSMVHYCVIWRPTFQNCRSRFSTFLKHW